MDLDNLEHHGTMESAKTVSAVILNYKNIDLTAKCVNYLIKSAEKADISVEIIVVDNSASESSEKLKEILPADVKIIENQVNKGFSRANNQGIQICTGEYILLLNNDAFINPECLSAGFTFLNENRNVGIWAPQLMGEDGSIQISCARLPSIKGLIAEYLLYRNLDWYNDVNNWTDPTDVGNVVGACMLIRKTVIDEVGLLDEDFFFSVEDVDYCSRVHEAGFKVIYDPRYSTIHMQSASSRGSWASSNHLHNNRVLYFQKHHGKLSAFIAIVSINLGLLIRKIRD